MAGTGVEHARRVGTDIGVGYEGIYQSTWHEGEKQYRSKLIIHSPSNSARFRVTWDPDEGDSSGKFVGDAILVDGKLIGYYRSDI